MKNYKKAFVILFVVFYALNCIDLITTSFLLSKGCSETRENFQHFNTTGIRIFDAIVKLFAPILYLVASYLILKYYARYSVIVLLVTTILFLFYSYVAINNLYVVSKVI